MTSRKSGDLPHVECIVIDEDTLRYGGSDFIRERKPKSSGIEEEVRTIASWAYANMEGCDGYEWELYSKIFDAACEYLSKVSDNV